jgi:hypothetical protein
MEPWQQWQLEQQGTELITVKPTEVIQSPLPALAEPVSAPKSPAYRIGCTVIGLALVALSFALVYASVRANAWVGFALSVDETAGQIFATLSVVAELIAFVMPTANRLYRQAGDRWTALRGSLMTLVASGMVFFAASGFVLINVSDKTTSRSASAPAVEVARKALDDIKAARDRECVKLGPVCRLREDAVIARQQELIEAMTHAATDPQATALHIDPSTLRLAQAVVLVAMCLLAGLVLSHGWGLVFRR